MSRPIYAIGDIHGQFDQLETALDHIAADGGEEAQIVFLGDYVDRGPKSAQVLELLIDGQKAGLPWITLKGNHDRMFEWFMEDFPRHDAHMHLGFHWFHERVGGTETLGSYGIRFEAPIRLNELHAIAQECVPTRHVDFLRSLKLHHATVEHLFVHAGIRPGVPLAQQSENDLVWIREGFLEDPREHGQLIVHGHTALDFPQHHGNRVNLDGGAAYGRDLLPAVIEGREVWVLTENGRQPLRPIL